MHHHPYRDLRHLWRWPLLALILTAMAGSAGALR